MQKNAMSHNSTPDRNKKNEEDDDIGLLDRMPYGLCALFLFGWGLWGIVTGSIISIASSIEYWSFFDPVVTLHGTMARLDGLAYICLSLYVFSKLVEGKDKARWRKYGVVCGIFGIVLFVAECFL